MSCHTIILWVARGLWYYVETPGLPKVDVWIIIIEFVTSPVWMRYFTIKWNEKQSQ